MQAWVILVTCSTTQTGQSSQNFNESFNISIQTASTNKCAKKRSISVGSIDPPMAGHNKQYILLLIQSCISANNIDSMGKKETLIIQLDFKGPLT
jgi:hypothetical protein